MKTIPLILLMIFFCSCGRNNQSEKENSDSVLEIDLLSEPESTVTKLSEIAENVEYIPLETTDSSLIGGVVGKIITTDNSIYIENINVILCFNIDGKFLFKLDKQGRGPEEYTYISDFDVSSENKILTILTSGEKFLVYSITENGFAFRRSVSLKDPSPLTIGMVPETDYVFLAIEPNYITAPTLSLLINTVGDTIYFKPNCYGSRMGDRSGGYGRTAIVYSSKKMLCFKEYYSDTVFYMDAKNMSFKPRIIFDTHGTFVTPEMWGHPERNGNNTTSIFGIYETSRYVFYYYWEYRIKNCRLFDKTTKTIYNLDIGTFNETIANFPRDVDKIKLKDDLSGGPDFTQDIRYLNTHCSGGKMFSLIDAITLKHYVAGEEFKSAVVADPGKKEQLRKLAGALKETDNPVLVMVTPKE
jgi:hypothetical protein